MQLQPPVLSKQWGLLRRRGIRTEHLASAGRGIRYKLVVIKLKHVVGSPTSSAAQGGGGSFKNRKPIGELGCCESGMAERIH